ncbi:MAG: PAS domain S-box protein [Myxococcales bacterium]
MEADDTSRPIQRLRDLERILGRTPVVVYLWRDEPGWPVDYVSQNFRQYGYEPEELVSGRLSYASIVHPDDLPRVESELEKQKRSGADLFVQEYRLVTRSGETRWVEERTTLVRDPSGKVARFEGITLDITRRKSDEALIRRQLILLRELLDAIPMPVYYQDANLAYQGCNSAFERMIGRSRAEIIGATAFDLWPSDLARTYEQMDRALLESPGVQVYDSQARFADGSSHDVVVHKATFEDETGAVAGLVGVVADVTERNRAMALLREARAGLETRVQERTAELTRANRELEQQVAERLAAQERLRESEQHYRELADSLPQTIFETDTEGRLVWCNRNASDMFGCEPNEPPGRLTVLQLLAPAERQRAAAYFANALAGSGPESAEFTAVRRDGSQFSVLVSSRPIVRDGRTVGLRGIVVDITERVELDRMKAEFLAVASHELRTPLTPLRLLIQHARRSLAHGKPVEATTIERMDRQAGRLTALVNDLLDISRLEGGALVIHPADLDLREVVDEVVDDYRRQFPDRTIELVQPQEPVAIRADRLRLEQVLDNLVDNAIKHAPGSTVEVRTAKEDGLARVSVTDHGPGIEPAQRERLFTRFHRAGLAPSAVGGLGLGLHISREIVNRLGGSMQVESEVGRGTTFTVTLPRARPA